ncbi:type II toxin-antitoxin system RelE/ParE family toxin [candidate division KSB1 bacterium]|nr:type II toxin-antitoxin system RelE/ParE family toxin [candidate division KSB1 bacterium]
MRIFKNAWFNRFSKREKISDDILRKAINRADQGNIDADLGGNIIKQRIARSGQGKSGGYRSIIIFKKGDKAFFMFGFAKSKQENITKTELKTYKEAAKIFLSLPDRQIDKLLKDGELTEI